MRGMSEEMLWTKAAVASANILTSVEKRNPRAVYYPAYIAITRDQEGLWEYARKFLPGHALWDKWLIALFIKAVDIEQAEDLVQDVVNALHCHAFKCYEAGVGHPSMVE